MSGAPPTVQMKDAAAGAATPAKEGGAGVAKEVRVRAFPLCIR